MSTSVRRKITVPDTKEQITDVVLELMKQKEIQQIKVTEIVNTLNISRSAFYLYFESVYDVLQQCEDVFFESFIHAISPYIYIPFDDRYFDEPYPFSLATLHFFNKNKKYYTSLLGRYGDLRFVNKVKENVSRHMIEKAIIEKYIEVDPRHEKLIKTAVIDGHFSFLQSISTKKYDCTDDELAILAYRLLFAPFRSDRYEKRV